MERLFKLMKSTRHNIKFTDLTSCSYDIIELGCKFSYLYSELMDLKVLTYLNQLLESRTNENEQIEILAIAYQCCKNMLVDHRKEVCDFIEKVAAYLTKFFRKNDLLERLKAIRIKFLDIIQIANCPYVERSQFESAAFATNQQIWISLMGECDILLKREITTKHAKYREVQTIGVDQIFLQCSARFYYYYYWSSELRLNTIEDDQPSTSKRARKLIKMDAMLENIKPSPTTLDGFNWKWFAILAEIMSNFPETCVSDDILKILNVLFDCQSSIENSYQICIFTKCCFSLLKCEKNIFNNIVNK